MTCHPSKVNVKTQPDTAGRERNFGLNVKNEADSSSHNQKQDPKLLELQENRDYKNEPSRETQSCRENTSEEAIMLLHSWKLTT